LPEKTVATRIHRAKLMLKQKLLPDSSYLMVGYIRHFPTEELFIICRMAKKKPEKENHNGWCYL